MKRAYCLLREAPVYRRAAFVAGLAACGFHVSNEAPSVINAGDLLCIWNRYLDRHDLAARFESEGGTVLVCENGYLTPGGGSPHDAPIREWFALARSYHNDDGVVPEGDASRWKALGVELKPWRSDGEHILVCPNRSFGTPGRYMPIGWAEDVAARLRKITDREVRIRPHPGNNPPTKPLAEDLGGAWATVIWQSSAGVHSLIAGVPVICEGPAWICKGAAYSGLAFLGANPEREIDREIAMQRLAWANWSLAEIQSGEAIGRVLRRTSEAEVVAAG